MFALLFGRAGVHAVLDCQINIPDQKRVRRLSHAFGVSQANENFRFRVIGMALTFTTLITSSAYLLVACWL